MRRVVLLLFTSLACQAAGLVETFDHTVLSGSPGTVFICMGTIMNTGPAVLEIAQGNYDPIPGVSVNFLMRQGQYEILNPGQQYIGPIAQVAVAIGTQPGVYDDFYAFPSYVQRGTDAAVFPDATPFLKLNIVSPPVPEPASWMLLACGLLLMGTLRMRRRKT